MRTLKFALGFLALLAGPVAAQQFNNVPDHSVIGRIGTGSGSGPSQAIPFSLLSQTFLSGLCQTNNAFPVYSTAAGAWVCSTAPAANTVYAGPSTGAAAQPAFRALVGADLPLPAASTLGGVFSKAAVASNWLRSLGTDGNLTASQPNFTDLAGSIASGQVPANLISNAMIRQGVARSVIGVTGNATANVADIQGTANQALVVNSGGTALAFGQVNLAAAAAVTGTLPLANGGTGDTGTAWVAFTASPACGTATITTNSARSKTLGKTMFIEGSFTITAIGTCTSTMTFNLPSVTAQSDAGLVGRETAVGGKGINCNINASGTTAVCSHSDASTVLVNERWQISGVFETQ